MPIARKHMEQVTSDLHGFHSAQEVYERYKSMFTQDRATIQAMGQTLYWMGIPKFRGDHGKIVYHFDHRK